MGKVIGPDVSFYQDEPTTPQGIDFAKMKEAANFVIVRAGQNLWVDPDFVTNWAAAKDSGLPRGSYWFYDSRADPKRQAELWIDTLAGDLGELPLFADIEEAYNGQYAGWRRWYDFLERLKQLAGNKEISIYTAYYYWRENAPNATSQPDSLEYFHQYPLWIAHYTTAEKPLVPAPWSEDEWLFWQYTETGDGKLYGVESQGIDLNYFNGDEEAFKQRFNLGTTLPQKYRVELSLREQPQLDATALGVLKQDDIVELLGTSTDQNWAQVKRDSDNLSGWAYNKYLIAVPTTPPDNGGDGSGDGGTGDGGTGDGGTGDGGTGDGGTGDNGGDGGTGSETGVQYQVTVQALNVREGPGTDFNVVGLLTLNQIVNEIGKTADGSWIQIRRDSDGLTGWCYGRYLATIDETHPPQPVPGTTEWYKVNTRSLYVREGPGTNYNPVGSLSQDQYVVGESVSDDGGWVQIRGFDGLTGWSSAQYLVSLGTTPPALATQKLFSGVTYYRKVFQSPRLTVAHVLVVDMRSSGLQFLVTPPVRQDGPPLCTQTTTDFMTAFGAQIVINGDGFYYTDYDPAQYCPNGGDPIWPNGFAASRGTVYNNNNKESTVYINKNNQIKFNSPKGAIYNAVSGDRMLVEKGKKIPNLASDLIDPRTAIGLNKNGRWLILAVVDGRQPGYSEGMNFPELADLMISYGAYTAMNLDGGGSSSMVIQGVNKQPVVLNTPFDEDQIGHMRAVANHLGIFLK
jgi:GH25 family lysozyme M1 (1,4-beta-N-acetylmuramidase)/uncharacterized protein YgiM (DUF1202 family)